ncbi:MAG: thioesterase family protein [Burkholderiaceae bacterium]
MQEKDIPTPFISTGYTVRPEYIDYNGHMNVGYYHVVFDLSAESFFEWIGLDSKFRDQHNGTTFALESHLHFIREIHEGATMRFESRLLDFDYKRFHYYAEMYDAKNEYLAASYESISSWVDRKSRRTAPMPQTLLNRLTVIKAAHDQLERNDRIGHVISVPRKG